MPRSFYDDGAFEEDTTFLSGTPFICESRWKDATEYALGYTTDGPSRAQVIGARLIGLAILLAANVIARAIRERGER